MNAKKKTRKIPKTLNPAQLASVAGGCMEWGYKP